MKKEEIRIGLVLYGGVSLAIYMNGVCNEFFRAVKGEGIYGLIKEVRESDIVIDIISGSSAGGINGIMMAYCLANKLDFSKSKKFWIEKGGLTELLNLSKRKKFISVFDSEGYYEQTYIELFKELSENKLCELQDLNELDLFITGTNFYGNDEGKETKHYNSLFLVKYRKDRNKLFKNNEECIEALARLARITSAFPGAFSPVKVHGNKNKEDNTINENLIYWGKLAEEENYFFIDGGAVRNKPFSSTIKAIFSRNTDKKIDRKLFYLNPKPDSNEKSQHTNPGFFENIKTTLFGISSFQSIKEDFVNIEERNKKLKNYFEIRNSLLKDCFKGKGNVSQNNFSEYYLMMRLNYFLTKLYKENSNKNFDDLKNSIVDLFSDNQRYEILLKYKYDLYYRIRRISFIVYIIYDIIYDDKNEVLKNNFKNVNIDDLREIWDKFNTIIEIYEIMISKFEKGISESRDISILNFIDNFFKVEINEFKKFKISSLWELKEYMSKLNPDPSDSDTQKTDLSKLILKIEKDILNQKGNDIIRKLYADFEKFDMILFPVQMNSDIMEKDIIEIIRVSPKNDNEICGEKLGHFAAFLKESWRANDIYRGRMDGCAKIAEVLLTENSLINLDIGIVKNHYKDLTPEYEKKINDVLSSNAIRDKNICLRNILIEIEQKYIEMDEIKNIESSMGKKTNLNSVSNSIVSNLNNIEENMKRYYEIGKEKLSDVGKIRLAEYLINFLRSLRKVILQDKTYKKNIKLSIKLLTPFILLILFIFSLLNSIIILLKRIFRMEAIKT